MLHKNSDVYMNVYVKEIRKRHDDITTLSKYFLFFTAFASLYKTDIPKPCLVSFDESF